MGGGRVSGKTVGGLPAFGVMALGATLALFMADRYAWENTPAIEPFITSMQKLADQNLAEREPPKWIEWLFHSHPSIGKRIAAANEWASKRRVEQPV